MSSLRQGIGHDPFLIGNGMWCESCCPDGPPPDLDCRRFRRGCNQCAGKGRVPFTAAEIIARTLAENRAHRERFVSEHAIRELVRK